MVHGQEFVAHARATRRYRPQLEAMNAGTFNPANQNGNLNITFGISADSNGNIAPFVESVVGAGTGPIQAQMSQQVKTEGQRLAGHEFNQNTRRLRA